MSKKIMILGASILQLPAIEKAKEMGLDVIAVDNLQQVIGFLQCKFTSTTKFIRADKTVSRLSNMQNRLSFLLELVQCIIFSPNTFPFDVASCDPKLNVMY